MILNTYVFRWFIAQIFLHFDCFLLFVTRKFDLQALKSFLHFCFSFGTLYDVIWYKVRPSHNNGSKQIT